MYVYERSSNCKIKGFNNKHYHTKTHSQSLSQTQYVSLSLVFCKYILKMSFLAVFVTNQLKICLQHFETVLSVQMEITGHPPVIICLNIKMFIIYFYRHTQITFCNYLVVVFHSLKA